MKTTLKYALLMTALIALLGLTACSDDDDDNGGTNPTPADPWVGTWLSTGADVAPILVALFNYDSVQVVMNADNTVSLSTHVDGGAWTTINGVYTVTESAAGDIDAIAINYTAFEQEGIVQVIEGTPDRLWLEAVQTVPDIGAVPLTPADGFGGDPVLLDSNIQKYNRQ